MNQPPNEHQKVLQDIDRLLAEAPDEAARTELRALRERLNAPELREMARDIESSKSRRKGNLVLEFSDPLLPGFITATGCVVATAICLFAIVNGMQSPILNVAGTTSNAWVVAAATGAFSVAFTALSFTRCFSVRFDTEGMASRTSGNRWRFLRVGAMSWKSIRSLQERADAGVLEVHSASGEVFDIPLRVVNYPILRQHLDNMVMLYGAPR